MSTIMLPNTKYTTQTVKEVPAIRKVLQELNWPEPNITLALDNIAQGYVLTLQMDGEVEEESNTAIPDGPTYPPGKLIIKRKVEAPPKE